MANHFSHASLPYPIKGARFTMLVPYLDADGDPTDPTTPDTEISKDAAAYADTVEEVATLTGGNGSGYITLGGAEMDCVMAAIAFKAASGPKATLATLYPRALPIVTNGTLAAGSAGGGTLGTLVPYSLVGCFIKTTGGTGGGGTGGVNNQARKIITHTVSSGVFTVAPNWETTPGATTTYDILLPEGATSGSLKAINLDTVVEAVGSYTAQQVFKGVFATVCGITTVSGATYTVKTLDGSSTRIVFTLDSSKQRTAVTPTL